MQHKLGDGFARRNHRRDGVVAADAAVDYDRLAGIQRFGKRSVELPQ